MTWHFRPGLGNAAAPHSERLPTLTFPVNPNACFGFKDPVVAFVSCRLWRNQKSHMIFLHVSPAYSMFDMVLSYRWSCGLNVSLHLMCKTALRVTCGCSTKWVWLGECKLPFGWSLRSPPAPVMVWLPVEQSLSERHFWNTHTPSPWLWLLGCVGELQTQQLRVEFLYETNLQCKTVILPVKLIVLD